MILAAHSEFFLHLLESGMRESEESVVQLHEIEPDALQHVLDYIYTGEIIENMSFDMAR